MANIMQERDRRTSGPYQRDGFQLEERPRDVVRRRVVSSSPFVDKTKAGKASIIPLPRNGHAWYLVDAVRASSIVPFDPRKIPPQQVGRMVDRIAEYAPLIAGGNLPSGITTLPAREGMPTTYRIQQKGTGTDHELNAFATRHEVDDPSDPSQSATALLVHTACRNDEVSSALGRLEPHGYPRRDLSVGRKMNNARG